MSPMLTHPCQPLLLPRRFAGTEYDAPRDESGNLYGGWHWNMPYSIKRDLPDWYSKELQRYVGKQS